MNRRSYRVVSRRLLDNGMALTAEAVQEARGRRRQVDFGGAAGISERTIRRMEDGTGATLTQALALVGSEIERGDMQTASYLLAMIGESLPLAPRWGHAQWSA